MELEIIRARKENADDLGYIHASSWKDGYKDIVPDELINSFACKERRADVFRYSLTAKPEEYYLFKVEGNPAGLAMLYKSRETYTNDPEGEIYAFYFQSDYWGSKYTHEAFEFCVNHLRELGFKSICLWVLENNIRARKFYEKRNFEFDGHEIVIDFGVLFTKVRYSLKFQ